ncbi:MAG TPA: hypothetical protein VGW98_06665 [Solirubrobacteraceae bacterium]|nr:hypothetical protein [Solirubrobacteraceae bacterium]
MGREPDGATGTGDLWIGGWSTTTGALAGAMAGMLVEGTLTAGTVVEGTVRPGTLTPATLTPATLTPATLTPATPTPGAVTAGTATADGAPGTDTAPATVLTEAPRAAPQSPAASAFTVVCSRLRRCASMFSHRALPSDTRRLRTPNGVNRTASLGPRRSG